MEETRDTTGDAESGTAAEQTPEPEATGTSGGGASSTDDAFGWEADYDAAGKGGTATGREWLAQLQSMIEGLASQAAPVAREIGAKAAELAAAAGEKAGPIAHKAAEATEHAGERIAERGREVAAGLRRDQGSNDHPPSSSGTGSD